MTESESWTIYDFSSDPLEGFWLVYVTNTIYNNNVSEKYTKLNNSSAFFTNKIKDIVRQVLNLNDSISNRFLNFFSSVIDLLQSWGLGVPGEIELSFPKQVVNHSQLWI